MDEALKCECGAKKFWYFGEFVRCPKCLNEMKHTTIKKTKELWVRRFNHEQHKYSNWEHAARKG